MCLVNVFLLSSGEPGRRGRGRSVLCLLRCLRSKRCGWSLQFYGSLLCWRSLFIIFLVPDSQCCLCRSSLGASADYLSQPSSSSHLACPGSLLACSSLLHLPEWSGPACNDLLHLPSLPGPGPLSALAGLSRLSGQPSPQPSPAQPSPAQPSPAQPSPAQDPVKLVPASSICPTSSACFT